MPIAQREGETREQFLTRQRENGRKGGMGNKGKKKRSTIDREHLAEEMRDMIARKSRTLFISQMALGVGTLKVFRIDTEIIGEGKNEKRIKSKPILVTEDFEIINALDFYYGQGEDPNDDTVYYFITTKDPENNAIKDMLDRTFGKAKESVAVQHSGSVGLADLLGKGALEREQE